MTSARIVIIGAGQSAAVAAHALRQHGYRGRITMVGRERHVPYERPPLSKAVLTEAEEPSLQVFGEDIWTRCDIDFLSGIDAVALDLVQKHVCLADGQVIEYEKCLLATGGEARVHASLPRATQRVHYIRTIDDALRLRSALRCKPNVGILGGGFLGLEVAHSSIAAGASVTLIERASCLLDRFLPAEASAHLHSALVDAGVQILLGTSICSVHTLPRGGIRLVTDIGLDLDVDEVVVAIGLTPNVALARDSGLEIAPDGGIWVDASCRTSNDHVFACGDCTSQRRPGQTRPTRLESWQNANEQARTAAAAMLGAALPVPAVPWFWTDQGSLNIQILGYAAADLEYVRRGDPTTGKALWLGHRHALPVHGVAINAGSELRALRPLFESGLPVPLQEFHLDSVNLRAWVKQVQVPAVVAV